MAAEAVGLGKQVIGGCMETSRRAMMVTSSSQLRTVLWDAPDLMLWTRTQRVSLTVGPAAPTAPDWPVAPMIPAAPDWPVGPDGLPLDQHGATVLCAVMYIP